MTFEEIVDQAIAMLQRRGRVAYRTLKRQFQLDDEALEDLKTEIIKAQRLAIDEDGEVLVWTGGATSPGVPAGEPTLAPRSYTPAHLAEKILLSKTALEGERKQVTVLFADLKASMELLADRDPEEARQLLDPVIERMMAAVHRYEGTVNQVMGDGIMALFGAPIAHEDHAVRACYAALAMQEAMRHYSEEVRRTHGITVQMRVGLNSGEVVVRAIDNDLHMDYSAIGQTTHLAARMEQLATSGSILLTTATLRLAEGFIQVKALGPVPVKGLAAPVEVCELVGTTAIRRRLQATAARGLTRFVGRETEFVALQDALERSGAGHGQVVAVLGEAGVGKSRLLYELVHSHRLQGWLVLESASVSYGRATPYFPIIDLLKRYAHIEEGDDARTVRAKVTGQWLTLDTALQDTIPAILALLEALPEDNPFQQLDPPQRRQRTLDALKRMLVRESQAQPLLLVCEDLHWIDSETQALLDSLIESLPTARLLLLVNYRPEYQHGWGSKTYYTQLRLDPLPPANAEELLAALLGHDAGLDLLKQFLITRTEGNPFFLEESVRTLVETGVLVGEPGTYQLARAQPTIHVPATVQAVLAARVDRLPAEEKRLLQTAAVIGHDVPLHLLQAIAELPEDAIHRGLTRLQTAEFLYETHLFPELEYTFKHALTYEVAYGSLLQERRRTLHAAIVEAIEGLYSDRLARQVEWLAHHAFRGEVWDKAVTYCRQAGVKATDRSAYQEATAYLEQALEALSHLPEDRDMLEQAIDIRLHLRPVLFPLGRLQRALDLLREAETYAEHLNDQRRLGQVLSSMISGWWLMGAPARAVEYGHRACAIAAALGDVVLQINSTVFLGQTYVTMGHYRRAADSLRRTIDVLPGDILYQRLGASSVPAVISRAWLACTTPFGAVPCGRNLGLRVHCGIVDGDADGPAKADASLVRSMPVGSHGSGAWRFLVWWQALHAPSAKASTPCERLSCRSAPGPNRALAVHATNTARTTMPTARKKHPKHQQPTDPTAGLPPLNLNAAGIDVGSAEHSVAVPPDRSPEPVRRFASFTAALHALADWLPACHIDTVVMESTGVYWLPLFQVLDARGLEVHLVNARHATHVPGRKTDSAACQWLQTRHPFGLLNGSFRPTDAIGVLRSYLRQRDTRITTAAPGIQHRQKARTDMNVQLANVISDLSGVTGLAIIRALLAGERDPATLAAFKDDRIKASTHTMATRLEGNWRDEVRFTRRQSLELYEVYQQKIAECDARIEAHLHTCDSKIEVHTNPAPTSKRRPKKARRNAPHVELHTQLYRISGVDVTRIDGIEVLTAQTLISESGLAMNRWKTDKHFASWLGFCPDNRISGGKGLTRGTRTVVNRAADALRLAAQHLRHSKSALGANYRRLRARLGAPKALTAMAHKLARLVYRLRKCGQQYVDKGREHDEARCRQQRLQWLQRQARELNLQLVPN